MLLFGIALFMNTLSLTAADQVVVGRPSVESSVRMMVNKDGSKQRVVIPPGVDQLRVATGRAPAVLHGDSRDLNAPVLSLAAGLSCVEDWTNSGGNAGRYGQSDEVGPSEDRADQLWPPIRSSLIAYQPVIEDDRVFTVRIKDFGSSEDPEDSPIVALDLHTGEELWFAHLPNNLGDWTTWIAGVRNGLVFASRSGNGATVAAKLYALDAVTGGIVWESEDMVTAGPYDGVVFAPDGDPVIGSFTNLMRIDAATGDTVWDSPRVCSVSGNCGAAINGNAVYVADFAIGGGHVIVRFDLETGARQYQSPVMGDGVMTVQNSPMAGPDGSVYLSRTMNNPANDFFFAFSDTGTGFVEKWNLAAEWTTSSEFGIGLDGSVYMVVPGDELVRLDSATGAVTATSGPLVDFNSPRIAIDGAGNVYLSNKAFASGRIYVFTADLTPIWDSAVTNINIGGPALGRNGTLVVCGIGTDAHAYRLPDAPAVCPIFSDGFESADTTNWSAVH